MARFTIRPPGAATRPGPALPALLALLLATACLVMAPPTRADPHDQGRHDRHDFVGRRHESRGAGPGLRVRERHDARRHREDSRHADNRRRGEVIRKRALRERHDRRARDDWHDRARYRHDWHEHDPWWAWNGWDDDGWHHHDGLFLGFHGPGVWAHGWDDGRFGWWLSVAGSWYFYPDGVPTGQVVVVQTPPTPADTATAPSPPQYWYYCRAAGKYYPYVRHCAAGWRKVPARPSGQ
ncbi:MAG TPA: hypothetical protein VFA95_13865 [Gammaproteobacteria bacterium]|nr:hypothetical protein [Gammaproteobacteria bacterium]